MYWTAPSAIGFAALFGLLAVLSLLDARVPSYPRRGWLPMATTRGDRIFLTITGLVASFFLWLAIAPDSPGWVPLAFAGCWAAVVLRWG